MTVEGGEPFAWDALIPHIVHPLKVAIVEAMEWIGSPVSASDLSKIVGDEKYGLSHISYHMVRLASAGAIEVVETQQVRGSLEKFYAFT